MMRALVIGLLSSILWLGTGELRAEGSQAVDFGAAKITPGKVSDPTPPKPSDRASKSKAAAAAARAGAGMQRVMCMKMMKDAQHESDPTNKALMQMMASQACQQASQTEQNADKNDKQDKLLSADETPKQSQLTAGSFELKKSDGKEPSLPMDDTSSSGDTSSPGDAGPLVDPINPDNYTLMKPTSAPTDEPRPVAVATDEPTSPLKPIKPGTTNYDESVAKQGAAGGGGGFNGGFGGSAFNNARTLAQDEKSGKAAQDAPGTGKARRQIDSIGDAGGGGGGGVGPSGSSDGEKSGGNEAFDALLAQMMGGGAPGAGGDLQTSGQDIIVLPGKQDSNKLPNIFEFASWRYQKATFEEGRIHPHAPKSPQLPETAKVARVSKH